MRSGGMAPCGWNGAVEVQTMAVRSIAHPGVDDRRAKGSEARNRTPLSSHAGWTPAADRPDPVALLEEQDATREPDLVPVRHGRMLVSPFTFYRGAAKIMAADLDATPTAGLQAQLCGDAHLLNFGLFASPERLLLFDLNDFDETLPGRSNTTSSAWRQASRSPDATTALPRRTRTRRRWRRWRPIGRRWPASRRWAPWLSGTRAWTKTS